MREEGFALDTRIGGRDPLPGVASTKKHDETKPRCTLTRMIRVIFLVDPGMIAKTGETASSRIMPTPLIPPFEGVARIDMNPALVTTLP